jgi:hypothetical protein
VLTGALQNSHIPLCIPLFALLYFPARNRIFALTKHCQYTVIARTIHVAKSFVIRIFTHYDPFVTHFWHPFVTHFLPLYFPARALYFEARFGCSMHYSCTCLYATDLAFVPIVGHWYSVLYFPARCGQMC